MVTSSGDSETKAWCSSGSGDDYWWMPRICYEAWNDRSSHENTSYSMPEAFIILRSDSLLNNGIMAEPLHLSAHQRARIDRPAQSS